MTAKPATGADAPHRSLRTLYAFVRDHLTVVNGLVLASGSVCSAIEALAPGFPMLVGAIRMATALGVGVIVLLALAPKLARRAARGIAPKREGAGESASVSINPPARQLCLWEEQGGLAP